MILSQSANPVPAPSPPSPPASSPPPTAAAPAPSAPPRTKPLADLIAQRFPSVKVDYTLAKRLKVTASPQTVQEVALFARDALGFDHIGLVAGTDYPQKGEMEVVYFVGSLSKPEQEDIVLQLAERVPRDSPKVPSLCGVWPGAEMHEREAFEMLGISFEGHPDLRRLLLPEDWNDIPPLRKDYNSPGR